MPITTSQLIDYLQQFPPDTMVALNEEQANNLPAGDYIQLDTLDLEND